MSETKIRVLIVEDQELLAEGLASVLSRDRDLTVVGIASTGNAAEHIGHEKRPEVIIVDYDMAKKAHAELSAIRLEFPDVPIIMLTDDAKEDTLLAAIEAGASGTVQKSAAAGQFIEATRRASQGEMLIQASALAALIRRQSKRGQQEAERDRLLKNLTARELEVLNLMAQGLDNRAIAAQLVVSYTTARSHVQSILGKLGAHSKLEAVVLASDYGLLYR